MADINQLTVFASAGERNTDGLTQANGFPSAQKPARQWFNWLFHSVTTKINELVTAVNTIVNKPKDEPIKIGDIYMTTIAHANAAAVAAHHGYGTWQPTGGGTYLAIAGTEGGVTFAAGLGGNHTHEITPDELPEHDHTDGGGIYNKLVASVTDVEAAEDLVNGDGTAGVLPAATPTASYNDSYIQVADISTDQYESMKIKAVGQGQPIPIQPRRTAYHMWVRVADPE